jgi:hypothetical protein
LGQAHLVVNYLQVIKMKPTPIKEGNHWVLPSTSGDKFFTLKKFKTKKSALEWIEQKEEDNLYGDMTERKIFAAIIKGIIEHGDGTHFFGSLFIYAYHEEQAISYGYLTPEKEPTPRSVDWYNRGLNTLPKFRWMFWKDDAIPHPHPV